MKRRHSSRVRWSPRREASFRTQIAIAAVLLLALLAGGTTLYIKSRSLAVATDHATLCPTSQPLSAVTAILLDVSDRFSDAQRVQAQHQLRRIRDSIPRFGLVELYTLERLRQRLAEPVVRVCNPGNGADLNRLYQNPALAKEKWEEFETRLAGEIDRQTSATGTAESPIFEAIQATAVRTFANPDYDGVPKRLIIVSDLLQNVPGLLSMYEGVPEFGVFADTPYYSQVRADLHGVSVDVYYLTRPEVHTQGREHLAFWHAYFRGQGAHVERVESVFGDASNSGHQ